MVGQRSQRCRKGIPAVYEEQPFDKVGGSAELRRGSEKLTSESEGNSVAIRRNPNGHIGRVDSKQASTSRATVARSDEEVPSSS